MATAVNRLKPKIVPITAAPQSANLSADDPLGRARYEQLQQHRLRMGRVKLEDLSVEDQRRPAFINLEDYKYSVEQVSFWDEIHPVCRIGGRAPGPQSKAQRQFLRDINTGKLVQLLDGINGNYSEPARWGRVKYNKEIRLSLGCCLCRDDNGELQGRRLPLFDYTNRWVVTITQYEEECIPRQIRKIKSTTVKKGWVEGERTPDEGLFEEDPVSMIKGIGKKAKALLARMGIKTISRFARLRSSRIKTLVKQKVITTVKVTTWLQVARSAHPGEYHLNVIDHRRADNPYKSRYGEACWRDHIRNDIRKAGWVSITELVRHMDKETATALRPKWGDKYFWYHDALSQLTCKRTRAWMQEEGLLKH